MGPMEAEAVKAILDSISIAVHRTRGGSLAVVFTDCGGGDKPLLGAYHSDGVWFACQWAANGMYADEPRKLDLIVVNNNKETA